MLRASFLSLLLLPALVFGQGTYKPLHDRFEKFIADQDTPGAVILVGNKDGIKVQEAFGMADIEAKKPMKLDTIFRIASMTKPITAIAIMILVDEGKLNTDDDVEKHLPEFKGQQLAVKEKDTVTLKKPARPIKVRDLLTHTAGLQGTYPKELASVYTKRNYTLKETTAAIAGQPLQFEPGSKWSYCNPGIDTLGRIVEVLSGQSFEEFMQKRIFDPLGMKDTTFFPNEDQLKRCAITYGKKDKEWFPIANTLLDIKDRKHPVPAGGLYSTGADLAQLYRMMLHKGTLNGQRIITEKSVEVMTKNQTGDMTAGFGHGMCFGFGWAVVKEPKGPIEDLSAGSYGHGGAFGTQGWIDPKNNAFYVLLIQQSGVPGGDGSTLRKELQHLGLEALKK